MTKRPRQFNLGPDYKITPYVYKPYKPSTIITTFRESKRVTFGNSVYEKNKEKRKMGPDIPVREYKYVPKKIIYKGIYLDKPKPHKGAGPDDVKQSNAEEAQTITATKPVQEIAYQTSDVTLTPLRKIDSKIWKAPSGDRNQKKPFVPPLNLKQSENAGMFPGYTGSEECHSIDLGYKAREFTERVAINSPVPGYESSEMWEINIPTLDRSCIWTPIGSPPISDTPARPHTPPSPETNIVPALAFRHAPPYQSYGLSHPNLVRGKFRAETPVLKGKHQRTLASNV
ncbi:hypothetical protein CHS0354_012755 [Potamilus streckersoni]|uniref:Uncharacterized protein n=1 Tax=Potamilus streckersoni TaxID=2493646 RepID=A0AAE0RV36_9BIVA|nr:hypothetical protein CHS0354_012755 [Potamilus streckersoni]